MFAVMYQQSDSCKRINSRYNRSENDFSLFQYLPIGVIFTGGEGTFIVLNDIFWEPEYLDLIFFIITLRKICDIFNPIP